MGHNSNNMGTTWVHQYNKWVLLIKIRGYTNSIGPNTYLYHEVFEVPSLQYVQAFDSIAWSFLERPLDFLLNF